MFGMIKRPPGDLDPDEMLRRLFSEKLKQLGEDESVSDEQKAKLITEFGFLERYLIGVLQKGSSDERVDALRAFQAAIQLGAFSVAQGIKKTDFLKEIRRADIGYKRKLREAEIIDYPIKYHAYRLWQKKPTRRNNAHATATEIVDLVYKELELLPRRPKAWLKNLKSKRERDNAIKAIAKRIRQFRR